jgi:hypothetical protein
MDSIGLFTGSIAAVLAYQRFYGEGSESSGSNGGDTVTVSAPGKALIAGGYLVLDRGNIGYTIAVSSRFYATTKALSTLSKEIIGNNDINQFAYIVVDSPQFRSSLTLRYDLNKKAIKVLDGKPNEFIEKCVWLCLIFIQEYYNRLSLEFTSSADFCDSVSKRKVLNGKVGIWRMIGDLVSCCHVSIPRCLCNVDGGH